MTWRDRYGYIRFPAPRQIADDWDERLLGSLLNTPVEGETMAWRAELDDRKTSEIKLAEYYAGVLNHGTDGHHRLCLIALLAAKLDLYETTINDLLKDNRLTDGATD